MGLRDIKRMFQNVNMLRMSPRGR